MKALRTTVIVMITVVGVPCAILTAVQVVGFIAQRAW